MTIQQLNDGEMEPRELTVTKILAREAERKKKEVEDVLKCINGRIRKVILTFLKMATCVIYEYITVC